MSQQFFVQTGIFASDPWRVVHRVVEHADAAGRPIVYQLVAQPGSYATCHEAQAEADRLNALTEQWEGRA